MSSREGGRSFKDQKLQFNPPNSGKFSPMLSAKTKPSNLSQQLASEQHVTIYSDEASMANGSNGESTVEVVIPQAIEEPQVGLVPQMHAQHVASLFDDRRIFVNAPQYHCHVQGAVGTDEEAE